MTTYPADTFTLNAADVDAARKQKFQKFLHNKNMEELDMPAMEEINAKVVFIKINRLYDQCLVNGAPDIERVKEAVRAMWIISDERRPQINYVFALYQGNVQGVFHVTSVSDEVWRVYRQNKCLPNFPTFPERLRQIDVWKARFATLEQAQRELENLEYQNFLAALSEDGPDPQRELQQCRQRVYFTVDDNVPPELQRFVGNPIFSTENPNFFRGRHPVLFNW